MNVEYFKNGTCNTDLSYTNRDGKTISYTFREKWIVNDNIIHLRF